MLNLPETIALPLKLDDHGTIRVSDSRVTLDVLIARHRAGDSPEAIHAQFDSVPLNDVYAVIGYYLANRAELDAYLQEREQDARRIRQQWEAEYTPAQRARTETFKRLADEHRQDKGE